MQGDGPGLGEGSVIPMNLLQGDLDSAGRADGPSPGSGKQPFSLMIPNKDKRAERMGTGTGGPHPRKSWSPGMLPCVSLLGTTGMVSAELQLESSCQLFFQQLPGVHILSLPLPCLRRNQEPSQPWGCTGGSCLEVHHPQAKGKRKRITVIKNTERIFKPRALPGLGWRQEQGHEEWGGVVQHARVAGTSRQGRAGIGKNNLFH